VEISCHIEPRFVVVVADVHNQRVSFPMAARIAHPEIQVRRVRCAVRVDQPIVERPLECHRNRLWSLEDLKREIQIHDARHAGYIALVERVCLLPILIVFGLLGSRPRLIRDFAAVDNGTAGGHIKARGVILKIGRRGTGRLPDAFEVRLAIRRARQCPLRSGSALRTSSKRAHDGDGPSYGQTVLRHMRSIFGQEH
jgi:hypothetical protein